MLVILSKKAALDWNQEKSPAGWTNRGFPLFVYMLAVT